MFALRRVSRCQPRFSTAASSGARWQSASVHIDEAGSSTKSDGFGGVSSALLSAIYAKPEWQEKLKVPSVTSKWREEFVSSPEAASAGLSPAAAARVFDACTTSLQSYSDLYNPPQTADDLEPEQLEFSRRCLALQVDQDELTFKCDCKCMMCVDGQWWVDEDGEVEDNSDDSPDEPACTEREVDAFLGNASETLKECMARWDVPKEAILRCKCVLNHAARRAEVRRQWLASNTIVHEPAAVTPARVPAELVQSLQKCFQDAETGDAPNWHPGTDRHVQDIIHPSTRCFVRGVHRDISKSEGTKEDSSEAGSSVCRWIASEFDIGKNGETSVVGPEGVHGCERRSEMEQALTQLLGAMVPDFSAIVSLPSVRQARWHAEVGRSMGRTRYSNRKPPKGTPELPPVVPVFDSRIQVIVKAASIMVSPDRPVMTEGSWHLEGVAEDRIVATGIYYVPGPGDLEPSHLSFRVAMDDSVESYPQDGVAWIEVHHGFEAEEDAAERFFKVPCPLGDIPTAPGSILVFPNTLQHKVSSVRLAKGATEAARRRLVVFWLVLPPSGDEAPGVTANAVGDVTLGGSISQAEADAYRELLMIERKYIMSEQQLTFERSVSLCEH